MFFLSVCSVGQLICALPEVNGRVSGVTVLEGMVYMLRDKAGGDQIEVYDVVTYHLEVTLTRFLSIIALVLSDPRFSLSVLLIFGMVCHLTIRIFHL